MRVASWAPRFGFRSLAVRLVGPLRRLLRRPPIALARPRPATAPHRRRPDVRRPRAGPSARALLVAERRSEIPLRDRIDRDPRDVRDYPARDPLPPPRPREYDGRDYPGAPPPLPPVPGPPRGRDDGRMRDRDPRARGGREDDRGRDPYYGAAGGPRDSYELGLSRGPPSSAGGYSSSRGRSPPPPLLPSHLSGPAPPYDYRGPPPPSSYGPPPPSSSYGAYDSRGPPPPPASADPRIDPRDPRYDPRYDSRSRYDDPRGPPPPPPSGPMDPRDARPGYYSSAGAGPPPPRSSGGYRDDYADPYPPPPSAYGSGPAPYSSAYPPSPADPYRGGPPPSAGPRFDDGYGGREPPLSALPPRRPDPRADPTDPYARGYNAGPPRGRSPPMRRCVCGADRLALMLLAARSARRRVATRSRATLEVRRRRALTVASPCTRPAVADRSPLSRFTLKPVHTHLTVAASSLVPPYALVSLQPVNCARTYCAQIHCYSYSLGAGAGRAVCARTTPS